MELRDDMIVLSAWRADDAPAVYEACQDSEIQRWIPRMPRPYTREHARAYVSTAGPLAIRAEGRVVGAISLRITDANTASIGYWCVREARGRGITTRALRLLCRHALEVLGVERIELTADRHNVASQRVAEKAGFQREGVMRSKHAHPDGHRIDAVLFSLLPGELID